MALSLLVLGCASLLFVFLFSVAQGLQHNLAQAKRSGLPYRIVPFHLSSVPWMILQGLLLPILDLLPAPWTDSWLPLSVLGRMWHAGYRPFALAKHDVYLAVSPFGTTLWSCDPEANTYLSDHAREYQKPVKMMQMLNVFGPTITASIGEEHRRYRKIITPSFNDKTHRAVWNVTISETGKLIDQWTQHETKAITDNALLHVDEDFANLALSVFSSVGYGVEMDRSKGLTATRNKGNGQRSHTLSFSQAIRAILKNMMTVFLTPKILLNWSPVKAHQNARRAYQEWKSYMEDMRDEKQREIAQITTAITDPNLLGAIVGAGEFPGKPRATQDDFPSISDDAVLGNMFIMLFAGHETTANSLVFILSLLAAFPEVQRKIQAEIDDVLGDKDPSTWTYEKDFNKVLTGYVGAVISESLRLYPPIPTIPKSSGAEARPLHFRGKTYTVPAECLVMINTSATNCNPRVWSQKRPSRELAKKEVAPFPFVNFNPDMWMAKDFSVPEGAYQAFGTGYRSCIGMRFAKVELCATLCRIFKDYSVELTVAQRQRWSDAFDKAAHSLSAGVVMQMALKAKEPPQLSLVRRGKK